MPNEGGNHEALLGITMKIEIEQHYDICILRCQGRFIAGRDLEYMQSKMLEIKNRNCGRILADFSEVSCVGSMGITFIVGIYSSVIRNPGGRFVLAGASPQVRQALDLTRLSSIICMVPDVSSGLAVFDELKSLQNVPRPEASAASKAINAG